MDSNLKGEEKRANFFACLALACLIAEIALGYAGLRAKAVSLSTTETASTAEIAMFACLATGVLAFLMLYLSMYEVARHKVLRGASRLDRDFGGDWAAQINCKSLTIASDTHCVLGQLGGGDCDRIVSQLGIDPQEAGQEGFWVSKLFFWKSWWLTPAWRRAIRYRI